MLILNKPGHAIHSKALGTLWKNLRARRQEGWQIITATKCHLVCMSQALKSWADSSVESCTGLCQQSVPDGERLMVLCQSLMKFWLLMSSGSGGVTVCSCVSTWKPIRLPPVESFILILTQISSLSSKVTKQK